jgi:RHS repeat-associated protein
MTLKTAIKAAVLFTLCVIATSSFAAGMSSTGYEMPIFSETRGGGAAYSSNYAISNSVLSRQPAGESKSANYQLQAGLPDPTLSTAPSCGVIINGGSEATKNSTVTLGLICSDPDGCSEVQISNNGFSWSESRPYSTITTWPLSPNDGDKLVFAKYKDASGNWSGICSAQIILDTTAPAVTATPVGGMYMDPQPLTLTPSESSTIYYTTDGSTPTTASTVYSGPITVANNAVVNYFAVDAAGNVGPVFTENYTVCTGTNLTISGSVQDPILNQLIPYALVTLSTGSQSANPNGTYSFTGLPHGEYWIQSVNVLNTPGYVTYQKKITLCQENVTVPIVLTKLDTTFGSETHSGYGGGPVNTSTGNFSHFVKDFAIPGRGMPFSFERGYNSQDTTNGPLGYGWNHNYNIALTVGSSGEVTVRWGDGRTETWTVDGTGYKPRYGVFNTLIKNGNTYTVTMKDMTRYNFNANGQLTGIVDENDNTITASWNGAKLASVTDTVGRVIAFTYDTSNRLIQVMDPIGRTVSFSYDLNGNLVSSTDFGGRTTTYAYDANHQITTITDPLRNAVITNMYDDLRKVVSSQRDALGAQTLYSYDELTKTTQIIDPLGNVSYHHYDELLRLVREDDARGFSSSYVYDANGSIQSVTDKNGNTTTYAYDNRGNVTTKTEPMGRSTVATYDPITGNPLTKTDARGYTTTFTYDPKGNLLTVTDPANRATTNTYDQYGQLLTVTDALGGTTTHNYDLYGNRVATTDPMGNTSTFTYDMVGRRQSESYPLGRGMLYEYDPTDWLLSITDALGGTSAFTYDASGNKTGHIDARGNRTVFAYDKKNRLITKTNPMGEREQYTWDLLDRRIAVRNPKGATFRTVYDALGNVLQEADALENRIEHEYDGNGNRTMTTDARGYTTTFTYDALNRLVKKKNPLGSEERYEYDLNGNRTRVTDASGRTTAFTYDKMNRLTSITDSLNNTTTNEYDSLGRLVTVTDARGNSTQFAYDKAGRMTTVTDAAGGVVTARYDEVGNRVSVTDTLNNTVTYEYDVLNRLTVESHPLANGSANRRTIGYDAVGNMTTTTDARGTTSYTYDRNNRTTSVTYPDNAVAAYTYDANGNRTSSTDTMGSIVYAFDALDRVSSITGPFGMTVGYTYDPNRNRTSMRYPGNKEVYYSYDSMNRLTEVNDWGGIATTYAYDAAGRIVGQGMGNGVTVTYTYDSAGRLIGKEDKTGGGAVIASYTYTLDANGNRTAMSMNQPLVPSPDAIDTTFTYDSANRVLSGNNAGGTTAYLHDTTGRRTGKTNPDSSTTQYSYNYNDRLTSVVGAGINDQYRYDSSGRRFVSIHNGSEARCLLDLNNAMEMTLAVMDSSNNIGRYYVYGDGLLYSVDAATGKRLYYHYDPIGSTVAITDEDGKVTDKYAYLPFGELSRSETTHDNRFTYVGKYGVTKEPNGLYFMRARFYDPETRRFMSVDPVKGEMQNPQDLNLYVYSGSRPTSLIDPGGTAFWESVKLIAESVTTSLGVANMGTSIVDTVKSPSVVNFLDTALNAADLAADVFDMAAATALSQCTNVIAGLGVEAFELGVGLASGVDNAEYERKWSAGYLGGYIAGQWIGAGIDELKYLYRNAKSRNVSQPSNTSKPHTPVNTYADSNLQTITTQITPSSSSTGSAPAAFTATGSMPAASASPTVTSPAEDRIYEHRQAAIAHNKARAEREYEKQQRRAMYVRLATELSKYSVLVVDMDRIPAFNSGSRNGQGVYGRR